MWFDRPQTHRVLKIIITSIIIIISSSSSSSSTFYFGSRVMNNLTTYTGSQKITRPSELTAFSYQQSMHCVKYEMQ